MSMYSALLISPLLLLLLLHLLLRRVSRRHPLPPGPSGFPILGALPLLGSMPHTSLARLAIIHGPIMYLKLGTTGVVVASTASAARTFLTNLDAQFANRPTVASGRDVTYGGNDLIFSNYGPRLKLLRKLSGIYLLSSSSMAAWAPARREEVGCMLRTMLASSGDQPIKVPEAILCVGANVMGRAMLSRRLFDEEGKDSAEFKDLLTDLLIGDGFFNIGDFIPAIAWMDILGVQKKLRRVHQRFDAIINKLLVEHEASAHERQGCPDFIDLVIASQKEAGGEGKILSDINIKGLIYDMITAGIDSYTVIIEWALAEMISKPQIMNEAQSEMDRVIGRDKRLEESDLPDLPYLKAVCKETLRKHPQTPLGIPHFTFEPCEVDGYYIPANTQLLVNIWAIGRDPEVWERPEEFDPERFLSGKEESTENDFDMIPFGAGRRMCPGKQVGLLMVQYILGSLVHSFDWRMPVEGEELNMEEKFGISLPKAVSLSALVSPRLVPEAYF